MKNNAIKKEFNEKQNKDQSMKNNYNVLNQQLKEKKMVQLAEKEHQILLKKQFEKEVYLAQQEEMAKRAKQKERQVKYNKELSIQLKEKNKRNQYSVLMSEYERSVNNNDINAYQNMDADTLSAKLPGFNYSNPQDKYNDKNIKNITDLKRGNTSGYELYYLETHSL